jgi:hypothetical protein
VRESVEHQLRCERSQHETDHLAAEPAYQHQWNRSAHSVCGGTELRIASLPLKCKTVDKGHYHRSETFGGHIGSMRCAAVAALCCRTSRSLLTLNSGVPAPDVAKWAGHSVEVLTRIYAGCVVGLDEVWMARMSAGLHPGSLTAGTRAGERSDRLGCSWGAGIGGSWPTLAFPGGNHGRRQAAVLAGHDRFCLVIRRRPQQDSNLRSRLRRPLLSPLSYGGFATPKGTSRKPRAGTSHCGCLDGPRLRSHGRPVRAARSVPPS